MPAGAHGAIWQFPHAALNWANGKRRVTCAKGLKEEYLMDLEKLIENAKVCCGDIETEDCSERCINPNDKRGNEVRWCSQWLIHDLHIALSALQAENEKLRARARTGEAG